MSLYAVKISIDPTSVSKARTVYGDPSNYYCGFIRFSYGGYLGPVKWINGLQTIHFPDITVTPFGVDPPDAWRYFLFPGIKLLSFENVYAPIDPSPGILAGIAAVAPAYGAKL